MGQGANAAQEKEQLTAHAILDEGIADKLGLTRGAVSKVLDKLEGKKWITRKISMYEWSDIISETFERQS